MTRPFSPSLTVTTATDDSVEARSATPISPATSTYVLSLYQYKVPMRHDEHAAVVSQYRLFLVMTISEEDCGSERLVAFKAFNQSTAEDISTLASFDFIRSALEALKAGANKPGRLLVLGSDTLPVALFRQLRQVWPSAELQTKSPLPRFRDLFDTCGRRVLARGADAWSEMYGVEYHPRAPKIDLINNSVWSILLSSAWIDNNIIEHYLWLIERRSRTADHSALYAKAASIDNHHFTNFASKRWEDLHTHMQDALSAVPSDTEIVLVPIHISGNHWRAGAISVKDRTLLLYDSMRLSKWDIEVFSAILFDLLRHLSVEAKGDVELEIKLWKTFVYTAPSQQDGFSCGDHMLLALERFSRNALPPPGNALDLWAGPKGDMPYRKVIYHDLRAYALHARNATESGSDSESF